MLPMFYQTITALRAGQHQDICVEPLTDYIFSGKTNSFVLGVSRFSPALDQYLIVFVKSVGALTPVAVTGLRDKQNLFVDSKRQWNEAEFARPRHFCTQLVELDLLEETRVNMEMAQAEQESLALSGFLAVSRNKLAELPADLLKQLQLDGWLELIYLNFASLSRFADLRKRLVRTQ